MTNVNNIIIGGKNVDSLLFDKCKSIYRTNFNDWIIPEDADVDVEVIENGRTLVIKKFKNAIPFIRLKFTPNTNVEFHKRMFGFRAELSGLNTLVSDGTIKDLAHSTWGGPTYYAKGLTLMPVHSTENAHYGNMWPWDMGIHGGGASGDYLESPITRGNRYGYYEDGIKTLYNYPNVFPNNAYSDWDAGFFVSTGLVEHGKVVDITDKPITVRQMADSQDITNVECWRVYIGDTLFYNKEKTFKNCWEKYGFVKKSTSDPNLYIFDDSFVGTNTVIVPNIVDLTDYLRPSQEPGNNIIWRHSPEDEEFWAPIKDWYKNNNVSAGYLRSMPFRYSGMKGELTINLYETTEHSDGFYPNTSIFASNAFMDTTIETINLNMIGGCKITVGQNLFRGARGLHTLVYNGAPIIARDLSGMFEFCGKLNSYQNNLIDWGIRGNWQADTIESTYINYAFEYSGLDEIPSFNTSNRFANNNTIVSLYYARQAFHSCGRLKKIGPVLDLILVDPAIEQSSVNMLNSRSLVDVRIKNLNHSSWCFDYSREPYSGNLPNLNQESVVYLFQNLCDLTKHNPDRQKSLADDPSKSFKTWESSYRNGYGVGLCKLSEIVFYSKFTEDDKYLGPVAKTNKVLNNMEITIAGLSEGERIVFGDVKTKNYLYTFTKNGKYTINKTNSDMCGFYSLSAASDKSFTSLSITNGVDSTNPHNSSASLYCPTTWEAHVTPELLTAAKNKGWSVYFGGTLKN